MAWRPHVFEAGSASKARPRWRVFKRCATPCRRHILHELPRAGTLRRGDVVHRPRGGCRRSVRAGRDVQRSDPGGVRRGRSARPRGVWSTRTKTATLTRFWYRRRGSSFSATTTGGLPGAWTIDADMRDATGAVAGDYDNDDRADVLVVGGAVDRLYHQESGGEFRGTPFNAGPAARQRTDTNRGVRRRRSRWRPRHFSVAAEPSDAQPGQQHVRRRDVRNGTRRDQPRRRRSSRPITTTGAISTC